MQGHYQGWESQGSRHPNPLSTLLAMESINPSQLQETTTLAPVTRLTISNGECDSSDSDVNLQEVAVTQLQNALSSAGKIKSSRKKRKVDDVAADTKTGGEKMIALGAKESSIAASGTARYTCNCGLVHKSTGKAKGTHDFMRSPVIPCFPVLTLLYPNACRVLAHATF